MAQTSWKREMILEPGWRQYVINAAGALGFQVGLPSVLIALRFSRHFSTSSSGVASFFAALLKCLLFGVSCCGIGAVVSSAILLSMINYFDERWTFRASAIVSFASGIVLAFLDLPVYLFGIIFPDIVIEGWRVLVLLAVLGGPSGLWTAWQARRSRLPEERDLPRFSLRTLVVIVLLWAVAMLAFQRE